MKATTKSAAPVQPTGLTMSAFVTRRETFQVPVGQGGQSIGQFLDEYLYEIARDGGQVADFTMEIEPDLFRAIYGQRAQDDGAVAE